MICQDAFKSGPARELIITLTPFPPVFSVIAEAKSSLRLEKMSSSQPVRKTWGLTVPGTCLDKAEVFMGKAIPNFLIDFLIVFFPLVEVRKLHVKTPQRFALASLFLLGALDCASSDVRFSVINKLNENQADETSKNTTPDPPGNFSFNISFL